MEQHKLTVKNLLLCVVPYSAYFTCAVQYTTGHSLCNDYGIHERKTGGGNVHLDWAARIWYCLISWQARMDPFPEPKSSDIQKEIYDAATMAEVGAVSTKPDRDDGFLCKRARTVRRLALRDLGSNVLYVLALVVQS